MCIFIKCDCLPYVIDFGARPVFIEKKIFSTLPFRLSHIPVSFSLTTAVSIFVSILCSALFLCFAQACLEQCLLCSY